MMKDPTHPPVASPMSASIRSAARRRRVGSFVRTVALGLALLWSLAPIF